MTIPVVDLALAQPLELSGSSGGGPGTPIRKQFTPGVYMLLVDGSDILVRDGDADALVVGRDHRFRQGSPAIAVRFRSGRLTIATAVAGDAVVSLLPVTELVSAVAGGVQISPASPRCGT